MCRPELIVNNDIARTAPITHEGSHSMRASLARIPLRNNGLTAFWRKFYESRPTLAYASRSSRTGSESAPNPFCILGHLN